MTKSEHTHLWLEDVDAIEERLETMKLTAGPRPRIHAAGAAGIVQATAGLLKGRVPSGVVYERRIRRAWDRAFRRRTA